MNLNGNNSQMHCLLTLLCYFQSSFKQRRKRKKIARFARKFKQYIINGLLLGITIK